MVSKPSRAVLRGRSILGSKVNRGERSENGNPSLYVYMFIGASLSETETDRINVLRDSAANGGLLSVRQSD